MGNLEKPVIDTYRQRYFLAVSVHGGFSRPAVATGVAQPVLTQQVQLFEQELGVELVIRNGRNALPSEARRVLLVEVRLHLDRLAQLVDLNGRDFTEVPARVSLGIFPSIISFSFDRISENLRQPSSNIELIVIEAYSGDLRNAMASGGLDLAISHRPVGETTQQAIDLLTERLVLVTSSPVDNPAAVSLAEALRENLILPSAIHQLRRIIDLVAAARGLTLTPALDRDSRRTVKAMLDNAGSGLRPFCPTISFARMSQRVVSNCALSTTGYDPNDCPAAVRSRWAENPGRSQKPYPRPRR